MKMQNVNTRTVALPIKNTAKFLTAFDHLISWMRAKIKSTKNCFSKNKDHSLCFLRIKTTVYASYDDNSSPVVFIYMYF